MPEGDGAEERIDPRYDPAFQRGYRGEVRTSAPSNGGRRENSPGRQQQNAQLKREDPTAQDSGVARPEQPERAAEAAPGDNWSVGVDGDGHAAEMTVPPSRVNPYIVALWIIGVGMTVVGVSYQVWAQSHAREVSYNSVSGVPWDVVLMNLAYSVSTPMITVGLATIVGLLFLLAVRSRALVRWR